MNISNVLSVTPVTTNRTLTQEELSQIEKEPITTVGNCEARFDFDQGDLCFAFYEYLEDKCYRLDYLPSYCGAVISYNSTRTTYIQLQLTKRECEQNPPLPHDTEGVKRCIAYVEFDSLYNSMPHELRISNIEVQGNNTKTLSVEEFLKSQVNKTVQINKTPVMVKIDIEIKNPNIGGIEIEDIFLNVSQKEDKILSDRIGSSGTSCGGANYIGCVSYPIEGLTDYHVIREVQVEPGKIDLNDSKYMVNGSLDYKYDNSEKKLSKSFSVTYP